MQEACEEDGVTREELYQLVWSKPMTKVGQQFNVSGSYMARVCAALRVPRPERGYWAQLAFGKAPAQTPLPAAQPGDQLAWSKDTALRAVPASGPELSATLIPGHRSHQIVTGTHPLLRDAKPLFEKAYPGADGHFLKPYKRVLVHINSSKAGLDKALAFAGDLFNALESKGHRVLLAADERLTCIRLDLHGHPLKAHDYYHSGLWVPHRATVVYAGTVAVGLAIVEVPEKVVLRHVNGQYIRDGDYTPPKARRGYIDRTWTTTEDLPSGRLRLIAYSPYRGVSWDTQWEDDRKSPLSKRLPSIVKEIRAAAVDLVPKLEEAERQAEIRRQEWLAERKRHEEEDDRRRTEQSVRDSRTQLSEIIQAWGRVLSLERFFQGVNDRAQQLPQQEREAVLERLRLAREFAGTQDPLEYFMAWKTPLERYKPRSNPHEECGEH